MTNMIMNSKNSLKLLLLSFLCIFLSTGFSQSFDIPGPLGSGVFGKTVVSLTNGNFVVADPLYDEGPAQDVGAVYLYNGTTYGLISTLKGSTANDRVGWNGVYALPSGNFVIQSTFWSNGSASNAGAVTWGNGTTGVSGVVSSSNSLVGSQNSDLVGLAISFLPNGNYVVQSPSWDNGSIINSGAVTWCSGTTGKSGLINSSNSFVTASPGENIGTFRVAILTNSNYVIWNILSPSAGGRTVWCDGTIGRTGVVNNSNSLYGNSGDEVGHSVTALSNGNYVVNSPSWSNVSIQNVGAVTWCDGTTGRIGLVTAANSLIGSTADDQLGSDASIALSNGNYLARSQFWNNGAITDAGAVTWCNGTTGTTGVVSSSNSLVGASVNDNAGYFEVIALTNGNYVVGTPRWDNGGITDVGAVTWGNGTTGTSGLISSSNSLTGVSAGDKIGSAANLITCLVPLTNGNYVVASPGYDNGAITDAGAVTWANGTSGTTGTVTSSNSLVGTSANDNVGGTIRFSADYSAIVPLANGNYVVGTPGWDNGPVVNAGAATWGNGSTGITGPITVANSLTGSTSNDSIATQIVGLPNGHYIVGSPLWDNGTINNAGAVTWCNGTTASAGSVTAANSLTGSSSHDRLADNNYVVPLQNSNYVVGSSYYDNGNIINTGVQVLCNGATGTVGIVNNCNSVAGTTAEWAFYMSSPRTAYNYLYNYLPVGRGMDNIVTIFNPTGLLLANHLDEQSVVINAQGDVPLITNGACRIIAKINPTAPSPVSGTVNTKVWVETTVPVNAAGVPFVARHYEITPFNNAATATAKITLYCSQQEFDDFNSHSGSALNLPAHPTDAAGKTNLLISKYGGSTNNGTGFPASYPGTASVINPTDTDILWNSNYNRWEITFNVTGFSGFFIQTSATLVPLTLLEFNANLVNNNGVLNWKTTNEINTHSFDIERSIDGINFIYVATTTAANLPGDNFYTYTDKNINLLGAPIIYYHLKQKDQNNRVTVSKTLPLHISFKRSVVLFPNPVIDDAHLIIINDTQELQLKIIDNTGRVVLLQKRNIVSGSNFIPVNLTKLAAGMYYLEVSGKTIQERIKIIKK